MGKKTPSVEWNDKPSSFPTAFCAVHFAKAAKKETIGAER
jgi:hypothetical protein